MARVIAGLDPGQRIRAAALGLHLGHQIGQRFGKRRDRLTCAQRRVPVNQPRDQPRQLHLPRKGRFHRRQAGRRRGAQIGHHPQLRQQHRAMRVKGRADRRQRAPGIGPDLRAGDQLRRCARHALHKAAHEFRREIHTGRQAEDPALPPQSFTRLEIEALQLAVQSLGRVGDDELTDAGQAALARIIATLPERQSRQALHAIMHSFSGQPERDPPRIDLSLLRQACWDEAAVEIDYTDLTGGQTRRVIWPLGLSYSERSLMLLAHCRLRMDHRVFHVNRITAARLTGDSFRPHRVALVRDYMLVRRDYPQRDGA